MPDEDQLYLTPRTPPRYDERHPLGSDLDFIMRRIAGLPTRCELIHFGVWVALGFCVLALVGLRMWERYIEACSSSRPARLPVDTYGQSPILGRINCRGCGRTRAGLLVLSICFIGRFLLRVAAMFSPNPEQPRPQQNHRSRSRLAEGALFVIIFILTRPQSD